MGARIAEHVGPGRGEVSLLTVRTPARHRCGVTEADLVVLGGGPAGLGAALHAARRGARVHLLEAGPRVGGLCRTLERDGLRYDLGGHIPFVRDDARRDWMAELVDDRLSWVPRPVVSMRGGRIRAGRYLDQRPPGAREPAGPIAADASAAEVLSAALGRAFVDAEIRPYLEKVDGVPLEAIPASRPLRLMRAQAAPDGFWFPDRGIGDLMDGMRAAAEAAGAAIDTSTRATAVVTRDGRVTGVRFEGPDGPGAVRTPRLVVAVPAGRAARLVEGAPPLPEVRMRGVCLVFLHLRGPSPAGQAWVQNDDPRVPFSRVMDVGLWSAAMAPPGEVVLGMECYCDARDDDPVWSLTDARLAAVCAAALSDPLGWVDDPRRVRLLEVVRMPAAYPLPDRAQLPAIGAAAGALSGIAGVRLAPGSEVLAAVEAGEMAADGALADGAPDGLPSRA